MNSLIKFATAIISFLLMISIASAKDLNVIEPMMDFKNVGPIKNLVNERSKNSKLTFKLPLIMKIEVAYPVASIGTAAVGRIIQGQVSPGDRVDIIGHGSMTKSIVTGIYKKVHKDHQKNSLISSAKAKLSVGDAAIILRGIKREELKRGMLVVAPGSMEAFRAFKAKVTFSQKELETAIKTSKEHEAMLKKYKNNSVILKKIRNPYLKFDVKAKDGLILIDLHNDEVPAEYILPSKNYLEAGKEIDMTLSLRYSMGLRTGMVFLLRHNGLTFGKGVVSEILF